MPSSELDFEGLDAPAPGTATIAAAGSGLERQLDALMTPITVEDWRASGPGR